MNFIYGELYPNSLVLAKKVSGSVFDPKIGPFWSFFKHF